MTTTSIRAAFKFALYCLYTLMALVVSWAALTTALDAFATHSHGMAAFYLITATVAGVQAFAEPAPWLRP